MLNVTQLQNLRTDDIMWNCFLHIKNDLAEHLTEEILRINTVDALRSFEWRPGWSTPYRIKCQSQVLHWLKRYRFAKDVFTNEELKVRTNQKFLSDQERIATLQQPKQRTYAVLQRARRLIGEVLGPVPDLHLIWANGSFSQNSTVGFIKEDVYLDRKVYPGVPLTCTAQEAKEFHFGLQFDPLMGSALSIPKESIGTINTSMVASLKQVNVPKTAVIQRPVRPNTLLGTFLSEGVRVLISQNIREKLGIDLNVLQSVHQDLARKGSRFMHNATADLSAASDSFTSPLMNRLLPRAWFTYLNNMRTQYLQIDGETYYSPSFMAMGIGYTFPLMSLCFLCLLRALQELSGIMGKISVFGDDLIYPRRLHPYVRILFRDLNFLLNEDKTFVSVPFRESCGGDYYDGVDVRPARPEGVSGLLTREESICAYVYKLFNSLIRRWTGGEIELPGTIAYLRSLLPEKVYHVPDHYPDTSGLKDGLWKTYAVAEKRSSNKREPFYWGLLIPCLIERSSIRPAGKHYCYYWEKLRGQSKKKDCAHVSSRDVLVWRKTKEKIITRNGAYRKMRAYTTKRNSVIYVQSLTNFGDL